MARGGSDPTAPRVRPYTAAAVCGVAGVCGRSGWPCASRLWVHMSRARLCATAFRGCGLRWRVVVVGAAGGAGVSGASYLRGRPQSSVSLGAPLPTLDRVAPPWRSRQRHAKGSMCSHLEGRRSGHLWGLYGRQHGAGGWVAAGIRPRYSRVRAGALYEHPRPCMHAFNRAAARGPDLGPTKHGRSIRPRNVHRYGTGGRSGPRAEGAQPHLFIAIVACAGAPIWPGSPSRAPGRVYTGAASQPGATRAGAVALRPLPGGNAQLRPPKARRGGLGVLRNPARGGLAQLRSQLT